MCAMSFDAPGLIISIHFAMLVSTFAEAEEGNDVEQRHDSFSKVLNR